jgi:hypothetical protein
MNTPAPKHRKRRIAADEAHSWARNLRLGDSHAKHILTALTLYVNGDGTCFVSIDQLAADTELGSDTVRRRMGWLEQTAGAIVRLSQWIDPDGRRNAEGRGRRTSDEIRLLLDLDADDIEAHLNASADPSSQPGASTQVDPSQQPGANDATPAPAPPLALGQPSDSGQGLISEPEPEPEQERIPPTPQEGGEWQHAQSWKEFEEAYREPILRQTQARQVWQALTEAERTLATKAAHGYVIYRNRQRKPPNVLGAHIFLKERDGWPAFAVLVEPEGKPIPALVFEPEGSEVWRATNVMRAIAGFNRLQALPSAQGSGLKLPPLSPSYLALAQFADDNPDHWVMVKKGTQMCGAWREFLSIDVRQIVVGTMVKELNGKTYNDWPVKELGLLVPCLWPPRKDGSLSEPESAHDTDTDLKRTATQQ